MMYPPITGSQFVELYELAKTLGVSFTIDYSEAEDSWSFEIVSAAPTEELYIKRSGYAVGMEQVLTHLRRFETALQGGRSR